MHNVQNHRRTEYEWTHLMPAKPFDNIKDSAKAENVSVESVLAFRLDAKVDVPLNDSSTLFSVPCDGKALSTRLIGCTVYPARLWSSSYEEMCDSDEREVTMSCDILRGGYKRVNHALHRGLNSHVHAFVFADNDVLVRADSWAKQEC